MAWRFHFPIRNYDFKVVSAFHLTYDRLAGYPASFGLPIMHPLCVIQLCE